MLPANPHVFAGPNSREIRTTDARSRQRFTFRWKQRNDLLETVRGLSDISRIRNLNTVYEVIPQATDPVDLGAGIRLKQLKTFEHTSRRHSHSTLTADRLHHG